MRGVLTQIRAAVLRRRAQTATVLLISLLASSVSTMALTLLVRSAQPWDEAFAKVDGPHLLFHFDASRVTADQLSATESLPGVTAAGPPRPTAVVPFERGDQKGTLQLIGRDHPGGPLDRLLLAAGRWPQRPGEIAVTVDDTVPHQHQLGDTIHALTSGGTPAFRVVGAVIPVIRHGVNVDLSNSIQAAWVLPSDIALLVDGQEVRQGYEMAYRFARATTEDELAADRREIEAALPAGSEAYPTRDWLDMRRGSIWFIQVISGIIFAFTVFALLAVAVIVGSIVAGSVLSSYREIGIIKALGFTPVEVLAVFLGQMAVPAAVGALLGIPLGAAASRPFLDASANAFSLPASAVFDPQVDSAVAAGVVLLAAAAALVPALRAAMTDSARAMTLGTAPPVMRRSRLAAVLSRFRAPRPLTLGAGDAFARPVRAVLTLTALSIGVATVTFAIGFQDLRGFPVSEPAAFASGQDVVVQRYPGIADGELSARLAEQPQTQAVIALRTVTIRLPGGRDPAPVYAMRGDPTALGYRAIQGRWFTAPGEAVIGAGIARQANLHIGDTVTGEVVGGPQLTLRVVGLVNDFITFGRAIRIDWDTLRAAMPSSAPDTYLVKLRPGSDAKAYAKRVAAMAPDFLVAQTTSVAEVNAYVSLILAMIGGLALVLVLIAAAGVFNATRLATRERMRDIAVLKGLGMTPVQIAQMAVASTLVLTVVACILGVPAGFWLERAIWDTVGDSYGVLLAINLAPVPLALALVAAFAIALTGSALPARWAAATPVAQVLRSE